MFKLKYNYVTNTSDEPYIQYWFAKKLSGIAGSTVTGEGSDFNIVSPTERSLKEVVLKGDTTQETSPNPDYPQTINTVTGDQTITITKGSDVQTYSLTLGDLELCKIGDYQDYIYKDGEKWYVKKNTNKVILDGSEDESWGIQNTGTSSFFYRYRQLADVGEVELQFYCNRATPTAISSNNTSEGAYIVTSSAATYHDFRVRYGTEMTVTNWKTFLSTHNFILYYILATPTDTEITDETLLGQLNTILSDGYLSAGTNTVQTSTTGLPIIINIKA